MLEVFEERVPPRKNSDGLVGKCWDRGQRGQVGRQSVANTPGQRDRGVSPRVERVGSQRRTGRRSVEEEGFVLMTRSLVKPQRP